MLPGRCSRNATISLPVQPTSRDRSAASARPSVLAEDDLIAAVRSQLVLRPRRTAPPRQRRGCRTPSRRMPTNRRVRRRPGADASDAACTASRRGPRLRPQRSRARPASGSSGRPRSATSAGTDAFTIERRRSVEAEREIFFVFVLGPEQAAAAAARGRGERQHDDEHDARAAPSPESINANDILKFPHACPLPRLS